MMKSMHAERTYRIRGREVPLSEIRQTLGFYLRNAIGMPPEPGRSDKITNDENGRLASRLVFPGNGLLLPLTRLLNCMEPSVVEIDDDQQPLSSKHRRQWVNTKWIVDYSGTSKVVVTTEQNSHYGGDTSFDACFRLQNQTRGSWRYATDFDLRSFQKEDASRVLSPPEFSERGYSGKLNNLLYMLGY